MNAGNKSALFHVTHICTPSGYHACCPESVSDNGTVVGSLLGPDWYSGNDSFIYRDESLEVVPSCILRSINSSESIAGDAINFRGVHRAAMFDTTGHPYMLPLDPPSSAVAINDAGILVGERLLDKPGKAFTRSLFRYVHDKVQYLAPPEAWSSLHVRGIGRSGAVVGCCKVLSEATGYKTTSPVFWEGKSVKLLTVPSGYSGAEARSIDNKGRIVCAAIYYDHLGVVESLASDARKGRATDLDPVAHQDAYIMDSSRVIMVTPAPDSSRLAHRRSVARYMSGNGTVVGRTSGVGLGPRAFMYSENGLEDLNDLIGQDTGWLLNDARAVSNTGYIACVGLFDNSLQGCLLSPVSK